MKKIPLPAEPTEDMITAAYTLIETMPKGSEARHKRIVAEVWRAMRDAAPPLKVGGLTKKQRQLLEAVADYIEEHGQSPSYREIMTLIDEAHLSQVYEVVKSLKRRGFIDHSPRSRRSIRILVRPGTKP